MRDFWSALEPHQTGGVYVNFLMNEGEERVRVVGQFDLSLPDSSIPRQSLPSASATSLSMSASARTRSSGPLRARYIRPIRRKPCFCRVGC